MLNKRAKA